MKKNSSFNSINDPSRGSKDYTLSPVREEVPKNLSNTYQPQEYAPMVDKNVSSAWQKVSKHDNFALSKANYYDSCKKSDGLSNHLLTGVMTFVMGVVTMVRMTKNMPKKLTDATLYSTSMYGFDEMTKSQQTRALPGPAISNDDYFTMMKRMNELEDKVNVLNKKPITMPQEKEEMLNNALERVDALEQQLSAAKKALEQALAQQEELLAYVEKKKKKKKFFAF